MEFGLRKFLIFAALSAGLATGFTAASVAARSKQDTVLLGRSLIPTIEQSGVYMQVRVESRVILRVPRLRLVSSGGTAASVGTKFSEKKAKKCFAARQFVGFRDTATEKTGSDKSKADAKPSDKQSLELLTRDGMRVRAYLGNGCLAREFYAGAYVERSKDGNICEDRDIIHARTGAKCEIEKFRLVVAQ